MLRLVAPVCSAGGEDGVLEFFLNGVLPMSAGPSLKQTGTVGSWLLEKKLGRGGQAEVWRVAHLVEHHAPTRAMKVCKPRGSGPLQKAKVRFEQEMVLTRGQTAVRVLSHHRCRCQSGGGVGCAVSGFYTDIVPTLGPTVARGHVLRCFRFPRRFLAFGFLPDLLFPLNGFVGVASDGANS